MALFINKHGPFYVSWTNSQKATLRDLHNHPAFGDVQSLQADGHELDLILEHFQNIPQTKGRVIIWRGEFARFIKDNLP